MLRSVKYGLYGAVLAGLVGGSVAWSSVDKTVNLVVDGQPQTVHTTASDVSDVLKSAGYHLGPHDLVAPAPDATVHGGSTVVYNRGRLLHLTVDGADREIWTTAPTVSDALAQLGYTTSDFTSVSRSQRLPLSATDITIRTPVTVTLVHGGQRQRLTTTDPTVSALLSDLGVTLGADDQTSVPGNSALTDGEQITIQNVVYRNVPTSMAVPYATNRTNDPTLPQGQTEVVAAGRNGVNLVIYAEVIVDGRMTGKVAVQVISQSRPSPQVVHVGTKVVAPASTPTPSSSSSSAAPVITATPDSAQAIAQQMLAARGWGSDQFSCLVQMWDHESGWRVNAANPSGAYGIPQALPGSKMAAYGADWQTNPATQIAWGLAYITSRYGTPCGAWAQWQANGGWY